ncbi:hypothetical protein G6F23_012871 [Rhizopus arrhizus]|nr:hypothetical protein G6F23_012871 [Rhizopus arrhizus]
MSVALRSSVTVVGSLAMLFVTSPRLAAWSLLGIPLAVLPIIIGARKLRTVARNSQDRIADANSLASETLGAVRTVQAHAREPYERGRFDHALGDAIKAARRRIGAQSLVTASAILLVFGAIVGVLWLGAHDVIEGRLSAGTLGQFVLYALIGGGSVGALAEVWNELQRAAGGMGRIAARTAAAAAWRNPVRRCGVPLPAAAGPGRAGSFHPARAAGHQPLQRLLHAVLALRVQRAGGFVQQQDRCVLQQRTGNRHALLLAAGQFIRVVLHARAEADLGQCLLDAFAALVGAHLSVTQRHVDVVEQVQVEQSRLPSSA